MTPVAQEPGIQPTLVSKEDFSLSVTALFDSRDHAEAARQDLVAAGIHAEAIALIADGTAAPAADIDDPSVIGFWQTLKDLFMPEEDRDQYAEAVRRGGVTLSVRTDTANHDRVIALLDRDGAVDLDERQEQWRNDGWTGYTARDPLAEARGPSLDAHADDEDMSYAPASAATAGFAVGGVHPFVIEGETAPLVESPGALPASALDAVAEAPHSATARAGADGTRDLTRSTPRVRSYLFAGDKSFPFDAGR